MKTLFEIVDFYPKTSVKNPKFIGTLHVYIVVDAVEIDLRGISVFTKTNGFFFNMPVGYAFDEEGQRSVQFPYISFTNLELDAKLKEFIVKEGTKYVSDKRTEMAQEAKKQRKPKIPKPNTVDAVAVPANAKKGRFPNKPQTHFVKGAAL